MKERMKHTYELMRATGVNEEPFGMYYTDHLPEGAFGPKEGPEVSREREKRGEIDFTTVFKSFSCFMGNVWLARKKKAQPTSPGRNMVVSGADFTPVFFLTT